MSTVTTNISTEIQDLSSKLLSTLDEAVFFQELSTFLGDQLGIENVAACRILYDESSEFIVDGKAVVVNGEKLEKGEGISGFVARTKRPYYSNNVASDPLFAGEVKLGVKAELCVPVEHEGIVIGTIHFREFNEERKFKKGDITKVLTIINGLKRPIENMKMYLSAKHLNEVLLKKIEKQELALKEKESGTEVNGIIKVVEKNIIGKSEAMSGLLNLADRVAKTDTNLVINGESGSGKEILARRVHCRSARVKGRFLTVDCSTLSEEQLEIELFGQEVKGGSEKVINEGLLVRANGGTLLVRNIHRFTKRLQAKFALFVREGVASRVGGRAFFRSNVRIMVLSSKDLMEEVKAGKFYEELFYALNVVSLTVPSLRERKDDIEIMASDFINSAAQGNKIKSLSPGTIRIMRSYNWPGNIRELQNVMAGASILAEGAIIEERHLPEDILNSKEVEKIDKKKKDAAEEFEAITLSELEKRHICTTLQRFGGNKTKSAKSLGITVKTLYNKLHNYGAVTVAGMGSK